MAWFNKKEKKTYDMEVVCANCDNREDVEIPKGMKVGVFCKNYACPECGCRTMGKEKDDC